MILNWGYNSVRPPSRWLRDVACLLYLFYFTSIVARLSCYGALYPLPMLQSLEDSTDMVRFFERLFQF